MLSKPHTLGSLRARIAREAPYIGSKPYSHNIISLILLQIHEEFGEEQANKAIVDFGLHKEGWADPRQKKGER